MDRVRDYQLRALQRQGSKVDQLRQAKQELDAKVSKCRSVVSNRPEQLCQAECISYMYAKEELTYFSCGR